MNQFERCTTTCEPGLNAAGAGELNNAYGVAYYAGDVFVADTFNNRIDEFSSSGTFIKAWGWGVADGASKFETCTTSCLGGLGDAGAGAVGRPYGLVADGSGDLFVADTGYDRVDEFSSDGAFIRAWGWGVLDGASKLETCTSTCEAGFAVAGNSGGAGQLNAPRAVAVDGAGDVFVANTFNDRVDEFSSSGVFIRAWGWGVLDGASRFETCTSTCEGGVYGGGAGELAMPEGIAANGSGDVFVADTYNGRVDEFSSSGTFIRAWGWGVADGVDRLETCTSSCRSGFDGGGAGQLDTYGVAVSGSGDVFATDGYNAKVNEFSASGAFIQAWGWGVADGQQKLETCSTTCQGGFDGGGAGQLDGPIEPAVDGSGDLFIADESNSRIDEFHITASATPVNTAPPVITGTPKRGNRVSCSPGTWTNNPTSFGYQWERNGTPLAGAAGHTYLLGRLDEGTTMVCVVTAKNAAGSAAAHSNKVKVTLPAVAGCPAARGKMAGRKIGQIRLGMTRAQARFRYRHHSNHGKKYEDFFCLTPIGIRVGYASPVLLKTLPKSERGKVKGRVVWASTANPYYSLDGVRPGESISSAAKALGTEPPFHIGLNYWYLARKAGYTAVLKVRGNAVEEIGIATNTLTTTRQDQSVLMHSFY
jgi:hypothetical protein